VNRFVKLNCLYAIANIIEEHSSLDEIMKGTVELLSPAMQYPEVTCARATLEGREFKTENFMVKL